MHYCNANPSSFDPHPPRTPSPPFNVHGNKKIKIKLNHATILASSFLHRHPNPCPYCAVGSSANAGLAVVASTSTADARRWDESARPPPYYQSLGSAAFTLSRPLLQLGRTRWLPARPPQTTIGTSWLERILSGQRQTTR